MPVNPVEVAALALIDSPSINTPVLQPTLVVNGGTLGLIAAGGTTPSPIAGSSTVHTDATMSGDGSIGTPLSVAPVGWDATQWRRIQALLTAGGGAAQLDNYQWTDLMNPNEYAFTTTSWAQDQTTPGGVLQNNANGTLTPAGMVVGSQVVVPFANLISKSWAVAVRFKLPTTPQSGAHFIDIINVEDTGASAACALRVNGNVSATVVQLVQTATNTACNSAGTVGSGLVVGTWYDALLLWDAAASVMTAQFNGVTAATVSGTTNIPNLNGSPNCNSNTATMLAIDAILWAFKRAV